MTTAIAMWAAAGWLGILASISPCPLATNIAAASYLSRHLHSRRRAFFGAVLYASGRACAYGVIGLLTAYGLSTAPELSSFLQSNIGPFVGPVLIFVALILFGWIQLPLQLGGVGQSTGDLLAKWGLPGEFLLGGLFALSFCPVSAALFFGALLPMILVGSFPALSLVAFGLGTALPVGVLAVAISVGAKSSTRILAAIQSSQGLLRTGTATVILLVGIYLVWTLSFGFGN